MCQNHQLSGQVAAFAQLSLCFSPLDIINSLPELTTLPWVPHVNTQHYQGQWDVVPLRCQAHHKSAHEILQSFSIDQGEHWTNLPLLQNSHALVEVLASLPCPVKAVRLMRLRAGAEIKPHQDPGLALEFGEARLHLPLRSDEHLIFNVADHRVPMQCGELWYLNANMTHSVHNRSTEDRINVVIDCQSNTWLTHQVYNSANCLWV